MASLSNKKRWFFVSIGSLLTVVGLARYYGLLKDVPYFSHYAISYIWIIGIALLYIGYRSDKIDKRPSQNDGIGESPGMGSRKKSIFDNDGSGSGGGDGGGGDGGGGG